MFKRLAIVCTIFIIIVSCNDNKKNTEPVIEHKTVPQECFQYISTTDTITLKLIHVGEAITGTLVYKLHEKDRNMGTIQGSMKGEWLIAQYTFMSEGVKSNRQVAFKKDGTSIVEGFGEVETKGDRVVFKNTDSLTLNNSFKLAQIACQ